MRGPSGNSATDAFGDVFSNDCAVEGVHDLNMNNNLVGDDDVNCVDTTNNTSPVRRVRRESSRITAGYCPSIPAGANLNTSGEPGCERQQRGADLPQAQRAAPSTT